VFFDGRNALEAGIGRFRGAVVPDVETTRDFVELLDSGEYDDLKGRPVVTYCTGGIRCEVLSSLMASRGFGELYQLEGGIARYGERFGDDGLWEGSLYVFDGRGSVDFSDHAAVIGACACAATPRSEPSTARMPRAARQLVVCESCGTAACALHVPSPVEYARRSRRRVSPTQCRRGARTQSHVRDLIARGSRYASPPAPLLDRRQARRPRGRSNNAPPNIGYRTSAHWSASWLHGRFSPNVPCSRTSCTRSRSSTPKSTSSPSPACCMIVPSGSTSTLSPTPDGRRR
jgi:rhodanese-related sulfurtransferase